MLIPVSQILVNPEQPRSFFDEAEMQALQDSMAAEGLLNPIAVEAMATPGDERWYMLLDGERRWRAARALGWIDIEANVRSATYGDARKLTLALVGNLQRSDMGVVDVARAYARLSETMTSEAIGALVGRSASHVEQHIKLLSRELCALSLDYLNRGYIPLDYTMLRALGDLDEAGQRHVVTRAAQGKWSATIMRMVIAKVGGMKHPHSRRTQAMAQAIAHGTPPAVALLGMPVNGHGPVIAETCRRCGMGDNGILAVCKECPLVLFLQLLNEAESAGQAENG